MGCLTVKELQQFLKIGANKAYELVHTDGFPSIRIGRRVIIPVDRLKEWLAEQSRQKGA